MANGKYYLITVKNSRAFQASDVRLNGLPVAGLHTLTEPGRLEFVAQPAPSGAGAIGRFKSLNGLDMEIEIADYGKPGSRRTLAGRVTSAFARPGGAAPQSPECEQVTFVFHNITW